MRHTRKRELSAQSRRRVSILVSTLLVSIAAGACGSSQNDLFTSADQQCFSPGDCGATAECVRNRCVPFIPCTSRTECGTEQVCDLDLGRCVQCLADVDCGSGEICVSRRCRVECRSDKDCGMNLLCDQTAGHCAACAPDAPCPDGKLCIDGDCMDRVCEPGARACANNGVVSCAADGSRFGEPEPCPNGCIGEAGGARCADEQDGSVGSGGGGAGGDGGSGAGGSGGVSGSGGASGAGGTGGASGGSGTGGASGSGGTPAAVLLIDRSTSAEALLPDGVRTRWSFIQSDVIGAVRSAEQSGLGIALGVYGYTAFLGGQCPTVEGLMPDAEGFARVADYVATMAMPDVKSETPTGAAIDQVTQLLATTSARKSIILITDGIPDTCTHPDQPCWDQTVYALQASHRAGVTTTVIGIGPDVSPELLQDLANAGAGLPVQTPPPIRVICGPNMPTYSPTGGTARYDHVIDSGLNQALLTALNAAATR